MDDSLIQPLFDGPLDIVGDVHGEFDTLRSLMHLLGYDGDGQQDLLLDIGTHYNVMHYALFLSSEAETGKLVKLVAELRLVGC